MEEPSDPTIAALFFFSGKGKRHDWQTADFGHVDHAVFDHLGWTLGTVGSEGDVVPGPNGAQDLTNGHLAAARRGTARRFRPVQMQHAGNDLSILRPGNDGGGRNLPLRMQRKKNVTVP